MKFVQQSTARLGWEDRGGLGWDGGPKMIRLPYDKTCVETG